MGCLSAEQTGKEVENHLNDALKEAELHHRCFVLRWEGCGLAVRLRAGVGCGTGGIIVNRSAGQRFVILSNHNVGPFVFAAVIIDVRNRTGFIAVCIKNAPLPMTATLLCIVTLISLHSEKA